MQSLKLAMAMLPICPEVHLAALYSNMRQLTSLYGLAQVPDMLL